MATDFQTLVSKFSLVGFIVGYPFNFQGSSDPEAVQVKILIGDLRKTGKLEGLSYTYWDESFTSKCVEALLKPLKLHPVQAKNMADKFPAPSTRLLLVMKQQDEELDRAQCKCGENWRFRAYHTRLTCWTGIDKDTPLLS